MDLVFAMTANPGNNPPAQEKTMAEPNSFTNKVIKTVRSIPKGRVATYRQVAGLAGKMHAARGVSWILNSCSQKYELPWQRVISGRGCISFQAGTKSFLTQRRLLRAEGVKVSAAGEITLEKYQYGKHAKEKPDRPRVRKG
jgi:methylated-DNA-protein-cysteine methyltransferase-like protein